jgi:hypothetical protein
MKRLVGGLRCWNKADLGGSCSQFCVEESTITTVIIGTTLCGRFKTKTLVLEWLKGFEEETKLSYLATTFNFFTCNLHSCRFLLKLLFSFILGVLLKTPRLPNPGAMP